MPLSLTYQAQTTLPVEVAGLTPTWARGKSLDEIRQFEVLHGNERLPLAELFELAGEASDLRLDLHGDLTGVHWLGAELAEGEIHVHGPVGRHLGSEMSGGAIHVHGDAGDWVGAAMRGGLIHVRGDAGDQVGAAYRGSPQGMTGGTILVDGSAGDEVGRQMRRGLIAIGGSVGVLLGYELLAGTILVFGECGSYPGAGMRRGTLGLFGTSRPALLPSFRYACQGRPPVLPLLFSELRQLGFESGASLDGRSLDIYSGDLVSLGRGEIFVNCET